MMAAKKKGKTAAHIREKFVSFFQKKGHTLISSSSLVPHNDDTLLFANAGMNQFKDYFTGRSTAPYPSAVTVQKCVRAGGKHNDLENIGFTARHHTYFEMLGNFSFGDYFKREAIAFAWEFLTKEMGLSAKKMLVTVHTEDDEALEIWKKDIGIPSDRIFKKGDKDNFWEMGEYGPCGPCSEIFYDYGKGYTTPGFIKSDDDPFDDGGRFVEIWNLVFMQYEKTVDGRRPLPRPSIDTGMGLERLLSAVNGVYFNYDTDLFLPLIGVVESLSGKAYKDDKYKAKMRVVADHARSCTMLITDGVIPSNEGRGYVLRRIIRRAVRCLKELGAPPCTFHKLVNTVFDILGDFYPQNKANQALAEKFLEAEEGKFLKTLDQGIKFLESALKDNVTDGVLDGGAAFKLYDTYGFPLDLTEVILREKDMTVDMASFEQAMERQRSESRKSWKGGEFGSSDRFHSVLEARGSSKFLGYSQDSADATLLEIIEIEDAKLLVFDQTPFYAESGGQIGDTGRILLDGKVVANIVDTQSPVDGLYVHYSNNADMLSVGRKYTLQIDVERRKRIANNHSATHLLHEALIQTLGGHVKQAGSLVSDSVLRFDFTHTKAVTKGEIRDVEDIVNREISLSLPVGASVMSMDRALESGATALFGEKYGDDVRVLSIGDFSTELCGGTHVENTSSIGLFSIISESSPGAGLRRVEAVTAENAIDRFSRRSDLLRKLEISLAVKEEAVVDKVSSMMSELKSKQKEISTLQDKLSHLNASELFSSLETLVDDIRFAGVRAPNNADLKKLSDNFVDKYDDAILLLYGIKNGKLIVLLRACNEVTDVDCKAVLNKALVNLGGRGGGKADMAQGSCDPAHEDSITKIVKDAILSCR